MTVRFLALVLLLLPVRLAGQRTQKPPLHGRHWVAITGKPLAATAGAMTFQKGGNPVDAACAMLAAVTTMWDVLSWGGETQALIYNPQTKKVIAINALGVAPTGATPPFYRSKGMRFPPEYGPLAAITPGTPGGLMTMLAEYGKLSLRDVLEPAIRMADGYAIEEETANSIERNKGWLKQWRYSRAVMLPHPGEAREAPEAGEILRQTDLAATLRKLVGAAQQALGQGKSRPDATMSAHARQRARLINPDRNDPGIKPGDPYPFQGGTNPYLDLLRGWPPPPSTRAPATSGGGSQTEQQQLEGSALAAFDEAFTRGTTSIEAADTSGWVVSITPSGGWIPAVIAGRTGIGVSQRAQQLVVDSLDNPFNVIAPGKRPRVTLTPGLALKDGNPFLAFAVLVGASQDETLDQTV